jgi:hypothetical protein
MRAGFTAFTTLELLLTLLILSCLLSGSGLVLQRAVKGAIILQKKSIASYAHLRAYALIRRSVEENDTHRLKTALIVHKNCSLTFMDGSLSPVMASDERI